MKKILFEVPDRVYYKLLKQKELDGFEDKEWAEWAGNMVKNVELEKTLNQKIRAGTKGLVPMWMKNFADNIELTRNGKTLRALMVDEITEPPGDKAVVIGRGPSLFRKKHLELLKKSNFDGVIVATDGILIDCLKQGIIPDYAVCVDGSPVIMKWFDDPLVDSHAKQIKILLNAQVNHRVAERIEEQGFDIYWFEPALDVVDRETSITRMLILMTCSDINPKGLVAQECGGNVGATSWGFSWNVLKRSNVAMIGFDYGYPEDMPLEETYYYNKTVENVGSLQACTFYEKVWHPFFKTVSHIDPAFKSYRENMMDLLTSKPAWQRTVNCTEGGCIFHPSLEYMYFADWLGERG